MEKNNVLLIATTADKRDRLDGETVKCKLLRDYLYSIAEINVQSVDTDNWKKHVIYLFFAIIRLYVWSDVIVLSSADNGAHIFLKFLRLINSKKKVYYFVIGGSLSRNIKNKKWNIKEYKNIKRIYVESRLLDTELKAFGLTNVSVLKNFRKIKEFESQYKCTDDLKFVYYGRVIKEKGIEQAIDLITKLNIEGFKCTLDIYGQITDVYYELIQSKFTNEINYKGVISPDNKVEYEILSQYDVFIFPTEYPGECLPGALIDSYIAGLAVLASNWRYAKEYINDGENGIIFQFQDYNDMYNKSKELFDKKELLRFKNNSKMMSKEYMIDNVLNEFKKEILEIVDEK